MVTDAQKAPSTLILISSKSHLLPECHKRELRYVSSNKAHQAATLEH